MNYEGISIVSTQQVDTNTLAIEQNAAYIAQNTSRLDLLPTRILASCSTNPASLGEVSQVQLVFNGPFHSRS